MASHIRVTAAPSFCERRLRSIGEQKAKCQDKLFTSKNRINFSTRMVSNFGKGSIAETENLRYYPLYCLFLGVLPFLRQCAEGPRPKQAARRRQKSPPPP
jgi:hypothetical protein